MFHACKRMYCIHGMETMHKLHQFCDVVSQDGKYCQSQINLNCLWTCQENIIDVWSMTTAGLASGYGRLYFNGRKPKVKVIHIGPDPPECFRRYIWGRSRKFIPENNKLSGDDHVGLYRKTANVCSLLNAYVYVGKSEIVGMWSKMIFDFGLPKWPVAAIL